MVWCELAGLDLELIRPIHVAAYMEKHPGEPLTKKQHLAAIRRIFSWYDRRNDKILRRDIELVQL